MYSKLLVISFILCAHSLFAQSHGENKKLQQAINMPSDMQSLKPQSTVTKRTAPLLSTTEDIRGQIKTPQELFNWMFSMSPIVTVSNSPVALHSTSVSDTHLLPTDIKLASDQPIEERKIEKPKDISKMSNQGQ
ncbi:hypothetical protein [Sphingobacterium tabacisoli]|uniref:Uncharacterized protein n=1 Tax=Sphingobacterium tabacisoli TaxID=2044855 RepID=A0ABW5KX93_9SPHI|nr:hypothetical protein [Sphingobacterium tabacisoli]